MFVMHHVMGEIEGYAASAVKTKDVTYPVHSFEVLKLSNLVATLWAPLQVPVLAGVQRHAHAHRGRRGLRPAWSREQLAGVGAGVKSMDSLVNSLAIDGPSGSLREVGTTRGQVPPTMPLRGVSEALYSQGQVHGPSDNEGRDPCEAMP